MIYVQFFQKLWKSRGSRIIVFICVLLILSSIVSDSLVEGPDSALTLCLGSLGVGGGAIFLGMNMMRLLPDAPRFHGQWRGQAALLIAAGGIFLYGAWRDCMSICFNW